MCGDPVLVNDLVCGLLLVGFLFFPYMCPGSNLLNSGSGLL